MIAIEGQKAHAVTLLRLAMYAETETRGNAVDNESFASALKSFSAEVSDSAVLPLIGEYKEKEEIDIIIS